MSFQSTGVPPPPTPSYVSGPGSGGGAAPSLPSLYAPLTPSEKTYYDQLFAVADTEGTGQLQGMHAVNFFKLSGLDVSLLKNIWSLADSRQRHFLAREDFYVALRLIGLAQNGIAPTREKIQETATAPVPYARFSNVPLAPPPLPAPATATPPQDPATPSRSPAFPSSLEGDGYAMSSEDRARYLNHFGPCDVNGDGFVDGPQAVELFSRSGLDRSVLGRVWDLADADNDSRLSPGEFAVAMHLIVCISKRGLPVPERLPPSLAASLPPPPAPSAPATNAAAVPSPSPPAPARTHSLPQHAPASTPEATPSLTASPATAPRMGQSLPASSLAGLGSTLSESTRPPSTSLSATDTLPPSGNGEEGLGGAVAGVQALAQKLKAEHIALKASVNTNQTDAARARETLAKTLEEVTGLQGELSRLRQLAATADEEQRQIFQSLGAARKHRELLLGEVEKARAEMDRLQAQKSSLVEEMASLKVEASSVQASREGIAALTEEHQGEAKAAQAETTLLQSLLSAMAGTSARVGREVEGLQGEVEGARASLRAAHSRAEAQKDSLLRARQEREAATAERHAAIVRLASGESGKPSLPVPLPSSVPIPSSTASSLPPSPPPPPPPPHANLSPSLQGPAALPPKVASSSSLGSSVSSHPSQTHSPSGPANSTIGSSSALPVQETATTSPASAPSTAATAGTDDHGKALSDGFDDNFGAHVTAASFEADGNSKHPNQGGFGGGGDDDFDFPAPEAGGMAGIGGISDTFPAPETMQAQSAGTTRAETTSSTGGKGSVMSSDAFASDPFAFPDDDAFGSSLPSSSLPPPAAAPAAGKKDDVNDAFSSSAFDKF